MARHLYALQFMITFVFFVSIMTEAESQKMEVGSQTMPMLCNIHPIPKNLSPASNSVTTDRTPIFSWSVDNPCSGTVYNFQWSRDPSFNSNVSPVYNDHQKSSTSFTPSNDLPLGDIYWRILSMTSVSDPDKGISNVIHLKIEEKNIVQPSVPSIESISPKTGNIAGNTQVKILGSGFSPDGETPTVIFGEKISSLNKFTDTEIIAYSPSNIKGSVDVVVKVQNLDSNMKPFHYDDEPEVLTFETYAIIAVIIGISIAILFLWKRKKGNNEERIVTQKNTSDDKRNDFSFDDSKLK